MYTYLIKIITQQNTYMKGDHIMKTLRISLAIIISALLGITNAWALHADLTGKTATFNTNLNTRNAPSTANGWYVLKNYSTGYFLYDNGTSWVLTSTAPTSGSNTSDIAGYLVKASGTSSGTILSGNEYYLRYNSGLQHSTTSTTWTFNSSNGYIYCNTNKYLRSSANPSTIVTATNNNSYRNWVWIPVTLAAAGPSHNVTINYFYDANNDGVCQSTEIKQAGTAQSVTEGTTISNITLPTFTATLPTNRFGISTPTAANSTWYDGSTGDEIDKTGTVTGDMTINVSIPDDMSRIAWNRVADSESDIDNWYTIRMNAIKNHTYEGWYITNNSNSVLLQASADTNANSDIWALVGNPYDGFLIINAESGLTTPLTTNALNETKTKYYLTEIDFQGATDISSYYPTGKGFCFSDGSSYLDIDGTTLKTSSSRARNTTFWVDESAYPEFGDDGSAWVVYKYWYDEDEDGEVDEGEIKYTQNTKTYPGMDMPTPDYSHFGIKYTVPAACSGVVPSGGKTVIIPLEDDMSEVKWTKKTADSFENINEWFDDINTWFVMRMNSNGPGDNGSYSAGQGYYVYNNNNTPRFSATESQAGSYLWALVGNPYAFKVYNYSAGYAHPLKDNSSSSDDGTAATLASNTQTFEAFWPTYYNSAGKNALEDNKIGFCLSSGTEHGYLNMRDGTANNGRIGTWEDTDGGCTFWVRSYVVFPADLEEGDYVIQNYASGNFAARGASDAAQLIQTETYPAKDPQDTNGDDNLLTNDCVWNLTENTTTSGTWTIRNYGVTDGLNAKTLQQVAANYAFANSATPKGWYIRKNPLMMTTWEIASGATYTNTVCWSNSGGTLIVGNGAHNGTTLKPEICWRIIKVDDYYAEALAHLKDLLSSYDPDNKDQAFCVSEAAYNRLCSDTLTTEQYEAATSPEKVAAAVKMFQEELTLADYNPLTTGRYIVRNHRFITHNDPETFLASVGTLLGMPEEATTYWNIWDATRTTTSNVDGEHRYTLQNEGNRYIFTPGQEISASPTTDNGYLRYESESSRFTIGGTSQELVFYPAQYVFGNVKGPYAVISTKTLIDEDKYMYMWCYSDHNIYTDQSKTGYENNQAIWQFLPVTQQSSIDEDGRHEGENDMIVRTIKDLSGHVGGVITLEDVDEVACLNDFNRLSSAASTAIANNSSSLTFTPTATDLYGSTAFTFSTSNGPIGPQAYRKALDFIYLIKSSTNTTIKKYYQDLRPTDEDGEHPFFLENMGATRPEYGGRLTAKATVDGNGSSVDGWECDYIANVNDMSGSFEAETTTNGYKLKNANGYYLKKGNYASGAVTERTTTVGDALEFTISPVIPCVWRLRDYSTDASARPYMTIGHKDGTEHYPLQHYDEMEIYTLWKFQGYNDLEPTYLRPDPSTTGNETVKFFSTFSYALNSRMATEDNPVKVYYCSQATKEKNSYNLKMVFTEVPKDGDYYYMVAKKGYLLYGELTQAQYQALTTTYPYTTTKAIKVDQLQSSASMPSKPRNVPNLMEGSTGKTLVTEEQYGKIYALGNISSGTLIGYYYGTPVYGIGMGFYPMMANAYMNAQTAYINSKRFVDNDATLSTSVIRESRIPGEIWLEDEDGTVTAIMEIAEDGTLNDVTEERTQSRYNGNTYDLTGRLVTNPTRGLYITNGKKVLYK